MNTILILLLLCIGFLILDVRNLHHRVDDIQASKDTTDKEQHPTAKIWVARDKTGDLFAYTKEPERGECVWLSKDDVYIHIPGNYFPNLRWEDNPMEAEMTIKQVTRDPRT